MNHLLEQTYYLEHYKSNHNFLYQYYSRINIVQYSYEEYLTWFYY